MKAPESEIKILEEFAFNLGIAYQIQDDINEFEEENSKAGVHDFPFLLALLNEKTKADSKNLPTDNYDFAGLKDTIRKNRLDKKAKELLKISIEKCYTTLANLQNMRLKLSLYAALGKVFKPLKTDE